MRAPDYNLRSRVENGLLRMIKQREGIVCAKESRTQIPEFGYGSLPVFRFQSFNGILNHRDSPPAIH